MWNRLANCIHVPTCELNTTEDIRPEEEKNMIKMVLVLELVNLNLLIKSVHYELNFMTNNAAFDIKTKKILQDNLYCESCSDF